MTKRDTVFWTESSLNKTHEEETDEGPRRVSRKERRLKLDCLFIKGRRSQVTELLTQKEEEEEEEGNVSDPDYSSCLQFLPVATRGIAAQNKDTSNCKPVQPQLFPLRNV